jgi:hypothetical protein
MSYSFPDLSSTFKNPTFGISSSINAFGGGPSSLLGGSKNFLGGSGSSMLGPILGLAGSVGSSFLGGMFGNNQAAEQMRMQNAIANQQIIEGRNLGYGQIASNIGGRVFASTVAPELDFALQRRAKREEMGPFAELLQARATEGMERNRAFALDPRTKRENYLQRKGRMEEEYFKQALPGTLAYGPTKGFASLAGKYGISV